MHFAITIFVEASRCSRTRTPSPKHTVRHSNHPGSMQCNQPVVCRTLVPLMRLTNPGTPCTAVQTVWPPSQGLKASCNNPNCQPKLPACTRCREHAHQPHAACAAFYCLYYRTPPRTFRAPALLDAGRALLPVLPADSCKWHRCLALLKLRWSLLRQSPPLPPGQQQLQPPPAERSLSCGGASAPSGRQYRSSERSCRKRRGAGWHVSAGLDHFTSRGVDVLVLQAAACYQRC